MAIYKIKPRDFIRNENLSHYIRDYFKNDPKKFLKVYKEKLQKAYGHESANNKIKYLSEACKYRPRRGFSDCIQKDIETIFNLKSGILSEINSVKKTSYTLIKCKANISSIVFNNLKKEKHTWVRYPVKDHPKFRSTIQWGK